MNNENYYEDIIAGCGLGYCVIIGIVMYVAFFVAAIVGVAALAMWLMDKPDGMERRITRIGKKIRKFMTWILEKLDIFGRWMREKILNLMNYMKTRWEQKKEKTLNTEITDISEI